MLNKTNAILFASLIAMASPYAIAESDSSRERVQTKRVYTVDDLSAGFKDPAFTSNINKSTSSSSNSTATATGTASSNGMTSTSNSASSDKSSDSSTDSSTDNSMMKHGVTYRVTVTNISPSHSFTPVLAATHKNRPEFFKLGMKASDQLAELAESGNVAPLKMALDAMPEVSATTMTDGLLKPGETKTFTITSPRGFKKFSMAAMLIPTNDTFMAIDSTSLPRRGGKTIIANAYDAGTEKNTELCADIPGPTCNGAGPSPNDAGEGFVTYSAGIAGVADLSASTSFNSKVAVVKILRLR